MRSRSTIPDALLCLAILLICAAFTEALGSGTCNGHSCDDEATTLNSTLTNTVKGDSSRALGLSSGGIDVDINQCLGSTSWGIIIFQRQKLVPNHWCEAEALYRMGFYEMAADMFCLKTTIAELEPDLISCRTKMKHKMVDLDKGKAKAEEARREEEDEANRAYRQAQIQRQEDYDARIVVLEAKANKPPPKPQITKQTIVEQKPLLPEETIKLLLASKYEEVAE